MHLSKPEEMQRSGIREVDRLINSNTHRLRNKVHRLLASLLPLYNPTLAQKLQHSIVMLQVRETWVSVTCCVYRLTRALPILQQKDRHAVLPWDKVVTSLGMLGRPFPAQPYAPTLTRCGVPGFRSPITTSYQSWEKTRREYRESFSL